MLRYSSPNDRHVWFDSHVKNNSWKLLFDRSLFNKDEKLEKYISLFTPWFKNFNVLKDRPITSKLVSTINKILVGGKNNLNDLSSHDEISKFLYYNDSIIDEIGLYRDVPPEGVHRMQTNDYWYGDFYSANLVINVLKQANIVLKDDLNYLDIGCSSGSLLRVLKWYNYNSNWYGCDPVNSSIHWAQNYLQGIHFNLSSQDPPLSYPNATFDGITAISIWSHHGCRSFLRWFSEVNRVLKPGGWFLFTTHGLRSLYYYLNKYDKGVERWISIYEGLLQNEHVFEQVWLDEDDVGNLANDWGNFYVRPEWVLKSLRI